MSAINRILNTILVGMVFSNFAQDAWYFWWHIGRYWVLYLMLKWNGVI